MDFLFTNVNDDVKKKYLREINIINKTYFRNQLIIQDASICDHVGIINSGGIIFKKVFRDSHETLLKYIGKNDTFGHDLIFSDNKVYNYGLYSTCHTNVSFISYKDLYYLINSSSTINLNFTRLLSDNLIKLNNESKVLRHNNLLSRLCEYLYTEYNKNKKLTFSISLNKTQLAEFFNTPRTSLSKEIKTLVDSNIIQNIGYVYTILDLEKLESYL